MKYTIEATGTEINETFEFNGKIYKKYWSKSGGCSRGTENKFCEMMEADGILDEKVLDVVYVLTSDSRLVEKFMDIAKLEVMDSNGREKGNTEI